MIINGGSNVNFTNNIVLGAKTGNAELNFCYQQNNSKHDAQVTTWPGNTFSRNILSWNSTRPDSKVFGIPGPPCVQKQPAFLLADSSGYILTDYGWLQEWPAVRLGADAC